MLIETLVKIDGEIIGHITPTGRYLERAAFRRLRPVGRLRAYLGLVAPHARRASTLGRICGVRSADVTNMLGTDIRRGRVISPGRGLYAVVREAYPTLYTTQEG